MTEAERLLRARIAAEGPLSVADWMAQCLGHPAHGYYTTRDPLGAAGDFVTAPEVSQMFGELIGAWTAQVWADQGARTDLVLAELGPGRGTMMRDLLRVTARVPDLAAAMQVWLVETSPALRARQEQTLEGRRCRWADQVDDLPAGPMIAIANEFFDALPVRQFECAGTVWRERKVGLMDDALAFVFAPPRADAVLDARFANVLDGAIVEVNPLAEAIVHKLAARIERYGGAALIIDYGAWDGHGDTLQAVRGHRAVSPLADPGAVDLTAHLRFRALAEAARPLRVWGPVPQGVFLERLGITERARRLAAAKPEDTRTAIAAQHRRLTHPQEMGSLFQVMALGPSAAAPPPGFEP